MAIEYNIGGYGEKVRPFTKVVFDLGRHLFARASDRKERQELHERYGTHSWNQGKVKNRKEKENKNKHYRNMNKSKNREREREGRD